jgi:hypothetical protein
LSFKEHGVMLYLDRKLYKAFIRLQADKELGRSYAGLLSFVEGLFHLGYLSKEDYEKYTQKYSQGLKEEEAKPLTMKELKEKEQVAKLEKLFQDTISKWDKNRDVQWRFKWVRYAEKYKDKIPLAKQLLELANKEGVS